MAKTYQPVIRDKESSYLISLCFVLVGLSSWIVVNGVYQELPTIAQTAPEGYDIYSYTGLLVAFANIFPFVYVAAVNKLSAERRIESDRWCTFLFVFVYGALVCVLMAFLWDDHSEIGGAQHSTALLILIFFAGGVDCMTSVLFYPLVQRYPRECSYFH